MYNLGQKNEQSEENKLGEITFLKKLVNQQINGVETIEGEFNCEEIHSILQKWNMQKRR